MGHEIKTSETLAGDVNCTEVLEDSSIRVGDSVAQAGV